MLVGLANVYCVKKVWIDIFLNEKLYLDMRNPLLCRCSIHSRDFGDSDLICKFVRTHTRYLRYGILGQVIDCERIVSFGDWLREDSNGIDPFFFILIDATSDIEVNDIDLIVRRGVVIGEMTLPGEADLENDLTIIIAMEVIHAKILLVAFLISVRAIFSKRSTLILLPNTNCLALIGFSYVFSVKRVSNEIEIIASLYCRLLELFYPVIQELLTPIISVFLLGLGETSILDDNQMEALTSCSGNFENLFETSSLADSDAGLTFEVDNGNPLVGVVGFVGDCCLGLNKGFDASSHCLGEGSGDVIGMSKNFAVDGFAVGNVSMILVLVVVSVSVSSECLLVPTKKRKACLGSMDKSEEGEGDEIVDMQSFLILEIADEGDVFAIVGVFGIDKRWINLGCKASSMKKSNINMTSVCKKIGNWFLRSSCSEVTCPEKVVGVRDELPQAQ